MVRTSSGKPTPFGLGWMIEDWTTGPRIGKSYVMQMGMLNGFRARLLKIPEQSLTVIMLANCAGELGWTWELPSMLPGAPEPTRPRER
jgi:CubicO group peptidase (beta-lactamase class C family)